LTFNIDIRFFYSNLHYADIKCDYMNKVTLCEAVKCIIYNVTIHTVPIKIDPKVYQ